MSDPFSGTWTIDLENSVVWDDAMKQHVADRVGEEVITLKVSGDVQDYEVLYGDSPKIRIGYSAAYDSPRWVDYAVREIMARTSDPEAEIDEFKARINASGGERERSFVVGQSYGQIRLVYVDRLTHYRVSRDAATGAAQSVMLRRMAADEQSYTASVLDTNGIVFRVRRFVRV